MINLVVIECDVSTTTEECSHVEHTVGVPAAEQVRQVEHEVQTGSYILEFVVVGVRISCAGRFEAIPATLALPSVSLQANTEHRRELIAKAQLYVGADQIRFWNSYLLFSASV